MWDARNEVSGLAMKVGAENADVCVIFPVSARRAGCDGLNLASYRQSSLDQLLAAVRTDTFGINVSISHVLDTTYELTDAEARALYAQMARTSTPGIQHGPLIPMRIHGLQAFHVRSELGAEIVDTYYVAGAGGITEVAFGATREFEAASAPLIASMIESIGTAPGKSLHGRIGTSLLSLLAGAPLVVLAAAIASRKKRDDD